MFTHVAQVRHIDSVNWASTAEMDYSIDTAAPKGFKRLYKYINGANQNGVYVCESWNI